MKRIIMMGIVWATLLASISGCYWGYPGREWDGDDRGGGHEHHRGEGHDRDGGESRYLYGH